MVKQVKDTFSLMCLGLEFRSHFLSLDSQELEAAR